MKTRTVRNPDHPWTQYKLKREMVKKMLQGLRNDELDEQLRRFEFEPLEARKDKIDRLLRQFDDNYREKWLERYGWPLEDVLNPEKFSGHVEQLRKDQADLEKFGPKVIDVEECEEVAS